VSTTEQAGQIPEPAGLAAITLAAGLGTRMRSARAKVLHELAGEPMIFSSLAPLVALGADPLIVVVGHQAEQVEAAVRNAFRSAVSLRFALQAEQHGTGHAARCAMDALPQSFHGDVLITYGDLPRLRGATVGRFIQAHRHGGAALSFISVELADAGAYGRVVRDRIGNVIAIVEAKDASPAEREIREINTGVYAASADFLRSALSAIDSNNAQGEYYLTDLVAIARRRGLPVEAFKAAQMSEFAGINSREELAQVDAEIRMAVNRKLMAAGVTLIDPATAYIGEQVEIGADSIIGPNVQILGHSRIGSAVRIEGTAWLRDVIIGDRCHLKIGVRAEECRIGEDCELGPFANLREGTELEGHNRIGNFVETKKARIGRGTKASHLSYLGDASIGRDTNIGCGVITVNYDGYDKHRTEIGDRCMVGCDTQLIAPVKVGDDCYVASGTTVLREVPDGSLAMSHHPQREKPGWTASWHQRHQAGPKTAGAKPNGGGGQS
jgi:bifunctional UDP-N-acetylglucosamine pyrophosphorylase/glucosamine-1-phosphate N-acetyltransferase